MKKKISFAIERVDNLGQGVAFDSKGDKVNLIPKTLPSEQGSAEILATKGKKVQFAKLIELTNSSDKRISPECIHFGQCSACSFLHTTYEYESVLKKESYSFLFRNYFDVHKIQYTKAPRRLAYRNRIQLHYDRRIKKLGYMSEGQILAVPHCLVPLSQIQDKLAQLYENDSWLKLVEDLPEQGHIELYLKDPDLSGVSVSLNQRYAHDGFSQVYQEMNSKIIKSISHYLNSSHLNPNKGVILDLFGGDGNLSQNMVTPVLVVDYYTMPRQPQRLQEQQAHQEFFSLNLYSEQALEQLYNKLTAQKVQWLLLDPPRSGLKNLDQFVQKLRPQGISYLSCNPNTQIRDIKNLIENGWVIESIEFLDLFPSTHHLESLIHLKKT